MYLLLVAIATFLYAIHEVLQYRFDKSVFRKKRASFWNAELSFKHSRKVFGYSLDAKHLTAILIFIILFLSPILAQYNFFAIHFLNWWQQLITCIIVFILAFNIFFNNLLLDKTNSSATGQSASPS